MTRYRQPGMYLVRASSVGTNNYALSFIDQTRAVVHVLMHFNAETQLYQLDGRDCAETVAGLLHTSSNQDQAWLPCTLSVVCPQAISLARPLSSMRVAADSLGSEHVVSRQEGPLAEGGTRLRVPPPDAPSGNVAALRSSFSREVLPPALTSFSRLAASSATLRKKGVLQKLTNYLTLRNAHTASLTSSRSSKRGNAGPVSADTATATATATSSAVWDENYSGRSTSSDGQRASNDTGCVASESSEAGLSTRASGSSSGYSSTNCLGGREVRPIRRLAFQLHTDARGVQPSLPCALDPHGGIHLP